MYGDFDEHLMSAENGIRKSRKNLKDVYKLLQEGKISESLERLKSIDTDLLDSLSVVFTNDKDAAKGIDGITEVKPNWSKR